MFVKIAVLAGALLCVAVPPLSAAENIKAIWVRPSTGAHIASFPCGGGLGLKIVKSPVQAERGEILTCGAKPLGAHRYKGTLTSSLQGKTYTGYMTIKGDSLHLKGCALGFILCRSEVWKRLK